MLYNEKIETIEKALLVVKNNVKDNAKLLGKQEQAVRRSSVAEALAKRAFSMASTAAIGLGILQKTLIAKPIFLTEDQKKRNAMAKKKLAELFGTEEYSYLEPILEDEDLDILEKAHEHAMKYKATQQ